MAHSAAILNAGEMCRIEGRGSGCSPRKRVREIREARYAALLALPRDVDLSTFDSSIPTIFEVHGWLNHCSRQTGPQSTPFPPRRASVLEHKFGCAWENVDHSRKFKSPRKEKLNGKKRPKDGGSIWCSRLARGLTYF